MSDVINCNSPLVVQCYTLLYIRTGACLRIMHRWVYAQNFNFDHISPGNTFNNHQKLCDTGCDYNVLCTGALFTILTLPGRIIYAHRIINTITYDYFIHNRDSSVFSRHFTFVFRYRYQRIIIIKTRNYFLISYNIIH